MHRLATILLACALLIPSAARAQSTTEATPESTEAARRMFDRASELYRAGRFSEAVALLLELQRIRPEPVLHYNLARAYEGLGRWQEATASYEAYLREDPTIVD